MLFSCCGCCVFVLLLLFVLINLLDGRPQILESIPLPSDFGPDNETSISKHLAKRHGTPKPILFAKNSTKTRILTHPGYPTRGIISFGEYSDQDIIFPDSFETIFDPIPRIDGPPKCANGDTFCEDFGSYPYLHLKDILEKNKAYKDLFGEDEAPAEISNRIGEDEDIFVCGSVQRTVFPNIGKNKDSKWKYIINQKDDGFVQGIRIETCRHHGGPCDIIGELPNGYTTSCKQKYVYRRLLSLSESGAPKPDTFQLPSACCCSYKRELEFLARINVPVTPIEETRI